MSVSMSMKILMVLGHISCLQSLVNTVRYFPKIKDSDEMPGMFSSSFPCLTIAVSICS